MSTIETQNTSFHRLRLQVFFSMFVGYALFYFSRKSFTYAMPTLMSDLHFDKAQLGILATTLSLSYGCSKFLVGMLADRSNPRYFMAIGLACTGIINIAFGFSSTLIWFTVLWALNGFFQGFSSPACAKLLTHWFAKNERGRWWSLWNTSHNVGGALIPLVATGAALSFGWRYAMFIPGIICIAGAALLAFGLRDTPEKEGMAAVDTSFTKSTAPSATIKAIIDTITNKHICCLGIAYFFVYFIRFGINDWTMVYLIESRDYSHMQAGSVISLFEIGGLFGSLAAGFISDKCFNGERAPINIYFTVATGIVILLIWQFAGTVLVDSILIFCAGFLLFGPQMMIGMAAAELASKNAVATATGFVGFVAYLGAATAGFPLGALIERFGWSGFFIALTCCAIIAVLLILPTRSSQKAPTLGY